MINSVKHFFGFGQCNPKEGTTIVINAELLLSALLSQFAAETESLTIVRTKLLKEDLSIFE